MNEKVINNLFGCFDRVLRLSGKKLVRFAHTFTRKP